MGIADKSNVFNKNLIEFIEFKNILDIAIMEYDADTTYLILAVNSSV